MVEVHCSTCLGMYNSDERACLGMCNTEMCARLGMCSNLYFDLFFILEKEWWKTPLSISTMVFA